METYPGEPTPEQHRGDIDNLNAYLTALRHEGGLDYDELYLLSMYLVNRLRLHVRKRLLSSPEESHVSGISPGDYYEVVGGLLDDCRTGVDRFKQEPMNVQVYAPGLERQQELERCMHGWAWPVFGEAFAYELLIVRDQRIGQDYLAYENL
jgi:hypothetical protein